MAKNVYRIEFAISDPTENRRQIQDSKNDNDSTRYWNSKCPVQSMLSFGISMTTLVVGKTRDAGSINHHFNITEGYILKI
jgi:hypothetical protein